MPFPRILFSLAGKLFSTCLAGVAFWATLMSAGASSAYAAGIVSYNVFKYQNYRQTGNFQPATPVSFTGLADINFSLATDLNSGFVTSSSPLSPMLLSPLGGKAVGFGSGSISTKAVLDADFPNNSIYTFAISGGTFGGQTALLSSPATDDYSATIPFFTDGTYSTLQNLNVANAITLPFNAWVPPPGVNVNFTAVNIQQRSNGNVAYSASGNNMLTSAYVAGNTLLAGTQYDLSLIYAAGVATPNAGFGTATAITYYDLRTDLIFTTATTAIPEPWSIGLVGYGLAMVLGLVRRRNLARRV